MIKQFKIIENQEAASVLKPTRVMGYRKGEDYGFGVGGGGGRT